MTAVEWLVTYMLENFHLTDESLQKFEQAKEIEKEQMKGMFDKGFKSGIEDYIDIQNGYDGKSISFEQYYNEAYGK